MERGALLFDVTIMGHPRPKARPRFAGGRVVSSVSKHEKLWKLALNREICWAVNFKAPISQPVYVDMDFWFATPIFDRCEKPHTFKPDKDNLEKLALDCLVKCHVLKDDSIVASGETTKRWMMAGGVRIAVYAVA